MKAVLVLVAGAPLTTLLAWKDRLNMENFIDGDGWINLLTKKNKLPKVHKKIFDGVFRKYVFNNSRGSKSIILIFHKVPMERNRGKGRWGG